MYFSTIEVSYERYLANKVSNNEFLHVKWICGPRSYKQTYFELYDLLLADIMPRRLKFLESRPTTGKN